MKRLMKAVLRPLWRVMGHLRRPVMRKVHDHAALLLFPLEQKLDNIPADTANRAVSLISNLTASQVTESTQSLSKLIQSSFDHNEDEFLVRISELHGAVERNTAILLSRLAAVNLTLASVIREQARCQHMLEELYEDRHSSNHSLREAG